MAVAAASPSGENGEIHVCQLAETSEPPSPCSSSKSFAYVLAEPSIPSIPHKELTVYREEPCIALSDNEIQKLSGSSKYTLIGKFSNGKPQLAQLRTTFDFLGFKGAFTVGLIDSKHVLIIFTLEEDYIRLFLNPISCVCGYPMKVFKWTINFNPRVECAIVPVWISLPNFPINSFEKSVLFSIVSDIGTPLMMDEATANQSMVSNARVCVELDLILPRIHRIHINTAEYSFWQEVVYENIPTYCILCLHQGHTVHECYLFDKMFKRIISAAAISDKKCNKNENASRENEKEESSSSFVKERDDISQADSFSNVDQSRDVEMDSRCSFSSASARTNKTKRRRERKRMREGKRKGKSETTFVLWEKPRVGFVKLNTDGCLKRLEIPSGDSSGGGILRDHEGDVLFTFHEYYGTSCCSALAAELKALLTGLKICHERGYKNIWVELDTQLAVKRISDPATDSRPGRNRKVQYLVDEVRSISSYLNVHYTNIYRQANSAADFLANEGFRTKERRIMEEKELPEGLKEILRASGRLLGQ
ncbi:uncharacterized protein LOC111381341 isoform X1 [Olea europaea var. sylvestris]|uniref:uncharacterized protein LOC111381341 isoform X1 n=2 Tax=Olea europaea var. sylvestris TaxID=158386 RepID=UPI000C1D791C|nr:uncharacterized protein LOC111381341 isoform X1 [Olea europaea var. sylvestris]